MDSDEEVRAFTEEVEEVENWWKTERWEGKVGMFACVQPSDRARMCGHTHTQIRPFSAKDVVSLRGTMSVSYPSDLMAKKAHAHPHAPRTRTNACSHARTHRLIRCSARCRRRATARTRMARSIPCRHTR